MDMMEFLRTRRTYRRFRQKAVPQDVVEDLIEAVRISSSAANRQPVRLVIVNTPEAVAAVQPLVKWAAYLPPEQGTPKADEQPTLYAAVVDDTSLPGDHGVDLGIALANLIKTLEIPYVVIGGSPELENSPFMDAARQSMADYITENLGISIHI